MLRLLSTLVALTALVPDHAGAQCGPARPGIQVTPMAPFSHRVTRLMPPAGYDGLTATPLIIALHGRLGSGGRVEAELALCQATRDATGALVAFPDGSFGAGHRFWNADSACCLPTSVPSISANDAEFLSVLIETIVAKENIDTRRIYVMGYSNGAFMAQRMARDYPSRIAGLVSVNGSVELGWNPVPAQLPGEAMHVLHVHASRDDEVLYHGGNVAMIPATNGDFLPHHSAPDVVERWNTWNGCATVLGPAGPPLDLVEPVPGIPKAETIRFRSAPCSPDGPSVELWVPVGLGHALDLRPEAGIVLVDYLLDYKRPGLGAVACAGESNNGLGVVDLGAVDAGGNGKVKLILEGLAPGAQVTLRADLALPAPPWSTTVGCLSATATVLPLALTSDAYGRASAVIDLDDPPLGIPVNHLVYIQAEFDLGTASSDFSNAIVLRR